MEDEIASNTTLDGLLRKLEDGSFINHAGSEAQSFLAELRRIAVARQKTAKGTIRIDLTVSMGRDGYALTVGAVECKLPKAPARPESTIYVDDDGDINGKPVPKQTTIYEVKGGKNQAATKEPAAQAAKNI